MAEKLISYVTALVDYLNQNCLVRERISSFDMLDALASTELTLLPDVRGAGSAAYAEALRTEES